MFPLPSIEQFKLQAHVKFSTRGLNFTSFAATNVISERKWNSLPADVRAVMDKMSLETSRHACAAMGADMAAAADRLKAAGIKFVEFSAADKATISQAMRPVGEQWAKQLDARGQSGTAVLNAFLGELKK